MPPDSNPSLASEAARISKTVTSIVLAMAALAALAPPLGYFLINYDYMTRETKTYATTSAGLLSRHIYGNPDLWHFESHRLEEILSRSNPQGGRIHQRILRLDGETIIAVGEEGGNPYVVHNSDILESGNKVGTLEVKQSLRPTLVRTGILALLSLLGALAVFLFVRVLPLRALQRAFSRLQLSQNDLKLARNTLDQSGEVIFITDREGEIVYFNSSFTHTRIRYPNGVLPKRLADFTEGLDGVHTDEVWQTLQRGEIWKGQYSSYGDGDSKRIADAVCTPITSEGNHEIHYIYMERDITERVKVEEALHASHRMDSLGNLAGGIAHDINNILTPILGFSDLLLEKAPDGSNDQKYLEIISKSTRRARDIISRILLLSREANNIGVRWKLGETVEEVVALLRSSLPPGIAIEIQVDEDLKAVEANPAQMNQLLMNLCVNAAKAMPEGGKLSILLNTVSLKAVKDLHGQTLTGEFVQLVVKDNGTGMDEKTKARIFEPFFTTGGPGEGSGLGLAIVYGIVKRLGGGITVSSRPGVGTRFDVYLPALAASETNLTETADPPPALGSGTLLVVDDEPSIVTVVKIILEGLGYCVEGASDPNQALEMFKSEPLRYDLVITDHSMPRLTGKELARELRGIRADIPIILCSGYSDSLGSEEARGLGFREILNKPVGAADLGRAVAAVLAQVRL